MTSSTGRPAGSRPTAGRAAALVFAEDVAADPGPLRIEVFSAEPGDPFERDRHRPLAVVACEDESGHNTVAEVVAGRVRRARRLAGYRRPVHARFHQYSPGPGDPGPAATSAITVR